MLRILNACRFLVVMGLAEALFGLPKAVAGPDEATKERCAAYAKRAVEQYQLMKSHPGCDAHLDALSWRDDYAYHYNGCIVFGNVATTLSDQGREGHLRACGAYNGGDASAAAAGGPASATTAPSTDTSGAANAPQDPGPHPTNTGITAAGAPGTPSGAGDVPRYPGVKIGPCTIPTDIAVQLHQINEQDKGGRGMVSAFDGSTLTYYNWKWNQSLKPGTPEYDTQQKAAIWQFSKQSIVKSSVQRPKFFSTSCSGFPPGNVGGPWVATSTSGASPARYLVVVDGGAATWIEVSQDLERALLQGGGASKPSASSAPATAAPAAAPAQTAKAKPKK
jgi:hypothetical protein